MLIPRFSLRTILLTITLLAGFFLIVGEALQGAYWALVISVSVICLLATLLVHCCFFLACLGISRIVGGQSMPALTRQGGIQQSADQQLPPDDSVETTPPPE